jgi:hypothetical protein
VVDLVIDLGDEREAGTDPTSPRVAAVLARERRGGPLRSVPWHDVARVEPGALVLVADAGSSQPAAPPGEHELALGRDVLDAQVFVFEGGGRMARVADVVLAIDGDGGVLRLLAVDVGFGAVCRRLGLRRLADRLGDDVIAWDQLHLASRAGHRVALLASRSAVHRVDAIQLAPMVAALASDPGAAVLEAVDPAVAASVVAAVPPPVAERLVRALSPAGADRVLEPLPNEVVHRLRGARDQQVPPRRRYLRHRSWRRRHAGETRVIGRGSSDAPDREWGA